MYNIETKVRYSEIGENGLLTIPSIIRYFQDCYIEHGESLGQGIRSMEGSTKAWFLGFWQICIRRRPTMDEKLTVGTKTYEIKDFFDRRNFLMYDEKEELLAFANSVWLYVDTKRKRPVKYDISEGRDSHIEEEFPMKKANRKIALPEGIFVQCEAFPVRKSHIDTNSHVNNCEYIRIAVDFLPEAFDEKEVRQVRVEYKKPAVLGDVLYPRYIFRQKEGILYMELCNEKGEAFVGLLFSYHEYVGDEE